MGFVLVNRRQIRPASRSQAKLGLLALVLLLATSSAIGQEEEPEILKGKAVEVDDGDTFTLCPKIEEDCSLSERLTIDLWGIDAPEIRPRKQFYAQKAKDYLTDILDSQTLVVEVMDTDDEGRKSAKIYIVNHENSNLNVHLVIEGYAWSTRKEDPDAKEYELAEKFARERGIGLWREIEPIPPWIWRQTDGDP